MNDESNGRLEEESVGVGLLDLLVVLAGNLKLLILGPAAVGLVVFGLSYLLPMSFTSEAILVLPTPTLTQAQSASQVQMQTPAQAAAIIGSPLVLDAVITSLQLAADAPLAETRMDLADRIKAVVGRDGLLRIGVTADTPVQAQAIANAVIDTWLKTTVPGEQDRLDLERRLAYAKVSFESARQVLERLTASSDKSGGGELSSRGDAGISIVALGELRDRYAGDLINIPRLLIGYSRDVIKQQPTLPTKPVSPRKGVLAMVASVAAFFALLLWVLARAAWISAAQDPEAALKQAKLRAALR